MIVTLRHKQLRKHKYRVCRRYTTVRTQKFSNCCTPIMGCGGSKSAVPQDGECEAMKAAPKANQDTYTAKVGDVEIARSNATVEVDGNQYFPPDALDMKFFEDSDHKTTCKWKGDAKYYNILVNEKTIANAAWYYPDCNEGAKNIEGMVGFYFSKVQVEKVIPGRIAH